MYELNGKVALVTGAALGIGLAYTKELLNNGLKGVALVDINEINGQDALSDVTKEFGKQRAIFIKADVSDKVQLEEAFKKTVETFKQLDIVINNAGICNELQWEKCLAINFIGTITGSMLAIEKYLPQYKSGSEAVIVNTASVLGLQSLEGAPAYCASKAGVVGFTRSMGKAHFERTNIRVVAICPSFTDTAIIRVNQNHLAEPYLSMFIEMTKQYTIQKPEDVAKNAMNVIREGVSGSAWIMADGACVEVEFPEIIPAEK